MDGVSPSRPFRSCADLLGRRLVRAGQTTEALAYLPAKKAFDSA